jgi:hypothetical protein
MKEVEFEGEYNTLGEVKSFLSVSLLYKMFYKMCVEEE